MKRSNNKNIPPDKLVRVTFMPEGKTVEFEFGTMPYDHHGKPMSFLDVAENFGIFLDHACGGVCACTTCHLWIKDQTGISEADDDELDRMDMAADQQLNSRLGCQAVITGPATTSSRFPSGTATTPPKASRSLWPSRSRAGGAPMTQPAIQRKQLHDASCCTIATSPASTCAKSRSSRASRPAGICIPAPSLAISSRGTATLQIEGQAALTLSAGLCLS